MTVQPVRVAHIVSHPIQYFAPLYRELSARREIDLDVYFYSDETAARFFDEGFGRPVEWDTDLLGGFEAIFCGSARRRPRPARFLTWPQVDIVRQVASARYDVVWAHGYAHLTTWLALAAARLRRKPFLLREEQTLLHSRSWSKRLLKQIFLRGFFSQVSALYIGDENRLYLLRYGVRPNRLFWAPYCVDNERLTAASVQLSRGRNELRRAFGITNGAPVVLFAGKLVAKKDPLLLLEAFEQLRSRSEAWLLVAGDGPLRAEFEEQVGARAIPDVIVTGFLNQSQLPRAYAAADIFVLPSRFDETWGLVVNEAMNFSLPIVVSDKVGCASDLVRNGWNGYVVSAGDAGALASALATLVEDGEKRMLFGQRSAEIVASYDIRTAADGIVAACLASARRRPSA